MSENNGYAAPSPRDLTRIVSRHSKKALAFGVLTFVVAGCVIVFWPRTYVSEAKLYMRIGRENATLDPTATTRQTLAVRRDQQNEINSLVDILQSRGLAERVADAVGVQKLMAGGETSARQAALTESTPARLLTSLRAAVERVKAEISDPVSDREIAVNRVQNMTEVEAPRESTVITIVCKADSPELAQTVAAAMTDVFLDEHIRLNRTKGTHEFFAAQSSALSEQLTSASRELAARKSEFELLTVEGKRAVVEEELKAIRLSMRDTDRALSAARVRTRSLQETLASVPVYITETISGVGHEGWDRMRSQLYDLEIAESGVRATYTDKHPKMPSVKQQLKEASEVLKGQPDDRTEMSSVRNPTYQAIEAQLLNERASVASLESTKQMLDQQHAGVVAELERLNDQAFQIAQMERKVEILDANYRIHAEKMEEARIDAALESQRISSVNVGQQATYVAKAVSPNNRMIALLAAVVAVCGGFGLALLGESLNQTLHTPEQTEAALDLPVLASIPRIRRHRFVPK